MLEFPRWKMAFYSMLLILGIMLSLPSLLSPFTDGKWPDFLPNKQVNLGLDLAGGSHILLEADPQQVAAQRLETMEESVRAAMRRANPRIAIGEISRKDGKLSFLVRDTGQIDAARQAIIPLTSSNTIGAPRTWNLNIEDTSRFILTQTQSGQDLSVDNAMETAVDVIRRRIDELGTREPTIIRQGDTRIVVQVPGLDDPEELKELLGKTAKLEFKLVDASVDADTLRNGRPPVGTRFVPYPASLTGTPIIAVKRLGGISGENLIDAQQGFAQDTNEPVVNITFDSIGGRRFAKLTSENVGRQFAVILDGEVLTAPVIQERILGGSSRISGNFTAESATQLAIALRSGALPIDLAVVEERSVGPLLGAESIRKGAIAGLVGTAAVLILMIAVYGRFGVYANLALILNLFLIFGFMASLNATLTLPGIAGFILTVGSAVDANVLINERIREERNRGRGIIQSIELGYKEASRAIYDANITNGIAGALLFFFGSGPIRGFAIVLMVGIFASVFTAVVVTRMFAVFWLRRERPTELHI